MKARLTALAAVLILCTWSMAQVKTSKATCTVKGVLLDSLTNEGEAYATIAITTKEKPDEAIKKLVTDNKGKFAIPLIQNGEYTITLSSLGRKAVKREFSIKDGDKTVDLGTLYISDAARELKGVEVVAQKPLVKSDIDKIEYNINEDPESKSSMLLEMLRKVPLVTVNGEDEIKVNGSSSFKVYVNGKPNNMMSKSPAEVLKSLPANTIKRVEVITNPGPKYDAEGVGGILNIVTEGGGIEGYTATFSTRINNDGVGAGTYGTVKSGKLTVSARYNYNYRKSPRSYSNGTRTTIGQADASSSDVASNGSSKSRNHFQLWHERRQTAVQEKDVDIGLCQRFLQEIHQDAQRDREHELRIGKLVPPFATEIRTERELPHRRTAHRSEESTALDKQRRREGRRLRRRRMNVMEVYRMEIDRNLRGKKVTFL